MFKSQSSEFGVGCKACHIAGVQSQYGYARLSTCSQLRAAKFQKHAESLVHLKAVASLFDSENINGKVASIEDAQSAPAEADFHDLLDARRSGACSLDRLQKTCGREKSRRMQFCLAEAKRMFLRTHLSKSHVLATHTDGKDHRLTVRFAASIRGPPVHTMRGTLGHVNGMGFRNPTLEQSKLEYIAYGLGDRRAPVQFQRFLTRSQGKKRKRIKHEKRKEH